MSLQPPTPPINFVGPPLAEIRLTDINIDHLAQATLYALSLALFINSGQPTRTTGRDQDDPKPFNHLAEAMLYQARVSAHLLQKRHPEDPVFSGSSTSSTSDLRAWLSGRFDQLDSNFAGIKKTTDELKKNTDELKKDTNELKKTTDELKKTTEGLKKTTEAVETQVSGLTTRVGAVETGIGNLSSRAAAVETKLNGAEKRFNEFQTDIKNLVSGSAELTTRVEALNTKVDESRASLSGLTSTQDFQTKIQEKVEQNLTGIRETLARHEERLGTLQTGVGSMRESLAGIQNATNGVQATTTSNAGALVDIRSQLVQVDIVQRQVINSNRHNTGNWLPIPNASGTLPAQADPGLQIARVSSNNGLGRLNNLEVARLACFYGLVQENERADFLHSARPGGWNTARRDQLINQLRDLITVPGSFVEPE